MGMAEVLQVNSVISPLFLDHRVVAINFQISDFLFGSVLSKLVKRPRSKFKYALQVP